MPEAGPVLDPGAPGQLLSATGLERLAGCPFRHLLERGLGVVAVEDAEPSLDAWLDPRTRGQVLHALYARFMRELRDAGERPDARCHGERLRRLGDEALAELRASMPPPSQHVLDRETEEFRRDLDLFLRLEAEAPERTPVGFEVVFGSRGAEGEPLARAEPVLLDLGPGLQFRLRGRIDRIDRLAGGGYEVVDYKTGRYWAAAWAGTFRGGQVLQHALYALAARELLRAGDPGAEVAAGGYYFPTVRGDGERVVRPMAETAGLAAVLGDLFELVRTGALVHTVEADDCRYCDFSRACGPDPAGRAKRKVEARANTMLAPYRRLTAYV